MTNEEKIEAIYQLIVAKTMPKDQFGFYTEDKLYEDISNIINN